MSEVKRYAAQNGKTLTSVIEEALRETLARQKSRTRSRPQVRFTTVNGRGLMPGVDLDDVSSLLDRMED